jgi:chemotaxis protein methyltransferase WspC
MIESMLRREIGLDAASIGSGVIDRTIRMRMDWHGLERPTQYAQLLASSRDEWEELIEAVVVTETWFFRDRAPFDAFGQLFMGEWALAHFGAAARILSVPCASGEEPYSLAMILLELGVAPERFEIQAADISARALARAHRGIYGRNSFRSPNLEFRDRHFIPTREGFALKSSVRNQVTLTRANLLDDNFLPGSPGFDFIFCRNLLIYFDRATQRVALAKLHRLLSPGGYLFVGPAEFSLVQDNGFVSARIPQAFVCRKTLSTPAPTPARRPRRVNGTAIMSKANLPAIAPIAPLRRTPPTGAAPDRQQQLKTIRAHADSGRLGEAQALCRAYLARHADCAEGYYLLGLVSDAAHEPDAITFYRKAIYLNPDHYEALAHATAWLEKAGDVAAARTLRRRAERARPKPTLAL